MMNILLRIIMLFALIFSGIADIKAQIAYNIPKRELRAVWLTTLNGLDWPSAPAANEAGIRRQSVMTTSSARAAARCCFWSWASGTIRPSSSSIRSGG